MDIGIGGIIMFIVVFVVVVGGLVWNKGPEATGADQAIEAGAGRLEQP